MKKNLSRLAYLLLFITISASCKKEKTPNQNVDGPGLPGGVITTPNNFVSATPLGSLTSVQIKARAAGVSLDQANFTYDVDYVKIVYKTSYNGKVINASGLLAIPKNGPAAPSILSAQHGTLFVDVAAPTNFPNPESFSGLELLASAGFITAIPDYIGYGDTKGEQHPYYDNGYAASAVVDMLTASKAYLTQQKLASSNRLFLLGYSEGGYITMAAQKEIETNSAHNLTVTGVAVGAGAYDLTEMLRGVATTATYEEPGFLATLLTSYNTTYGWNRPLTDFFQKVYADKIPTLLNGTINRNEINNGLSDKTAQLFNPTFYSNLSVPTGETLLKTALEKNSFNNWIPKSPTQMYHGTLDKAVFPATSEITFNRFKAGGATNVQYTTIPGKTHQGSFVPMINLALPWIKSLDK
jgi:pimeloyl-ACP methyl ester carboxylesterase